MLPILESTSALGIERGKDAYWEFVFPPLSDIDEILRLIEQLYSMGALPHDTQSELSLHMTIADIIPDRDTGLLLICLEILSRISGDRIRSGFHAKSPEFVAGWARK